jgi:segregation and condensation protein B
MSGFGHPSYSFGSDPGEGHEPEPVPQWPEQPEDAGNVDDDRRGTYEPPAPHETPVADEPLVAHGPPEPRAGEPHDDAPDSSPDSPPDSDAPVSERDREARRAIEAVVLASTEPVEPRFLAELVELPVSQVEALCAELAEEYDEAGRGFVLARVAGGYRFQTHPDVAAYVERFVVDGQHVRLSGPALETLAIVAYKQPISRGQISAIRGVNVEATLQTLVARGYVEEVGRDAGPGLALLYGTTAVFCERLGLDSTHDLPPLGDFVPDASIVEALERGLRMPDDPELAVQRDDAEQIDGSDDTD